MSTYFRTTVPKRYPAGRVCDTDDCTTILSVYNDDTVCHRCYEAIPVDELPPVLMSQL